jgi:hypothetical protein
LEENEEELIRTFITIRDAIVEYLHSAQLVWSNAQRNNQKKMRAKVDKSNSANAVWVSTRGVFFLLLFARAENATRCSH